MHFISCAAATVIQDRTRGFTRYAAQNVNTLSLHADHLSTHVFLIGVMVMVMAMVMMVMVVMNVTTNCGHASRLDLTEVNGNRGQLGSLLFDLNQRRGFLFDAAAPPEGRPPACRHIALGPREFNLLSWSCASCFFGSSRKFLLQLSSRL